MELFAGFEQRMEEVFRSLASCTDQSPDSAEVQRLIADWKSCLGQFMTCDSEMLACIATTYKFDARFKSYINQYSDEDLTEFLYSAIMHHIKR